LGVEARKVPPKQIISLRSSPFGRFYISLEQHMKCGVGKCEHCTMGPYHVCTGGPIFSYDVVGDLL
jgi:hypothetical protein